MRLWASEVEWFDMLRVVEAETVATISHWDRWEKDE
jgi:hypothetical protein